MQQIFNQTDVFTGFVIIIVDQGNLKHFLDSVKKEVIQIILQKWIFEKKGLDNNYHVHFFLNYYLLLKHKFVTAKWK